MNKIENYINSCKYRDKLLSIYRFLKLAKGWTYTIKTSNNNSDLTDEDKYIIRKEIYGLVDRFYSYDEAVMTEVKFLNNKIIVDVTKN